MSSNKQRASRVVVAISGGGRTLKNLLLRQPQSDYEIVGVISSSPSCSGNRIATENGLPLFVGDFSLRAWAPTAARLADWLDAVKADWIALAGFLKMFPLNHRLKDNIINIHPALLPQYGGKGMYGMNVHEAVLAAHEQQSGATIHRVNEKYDEGAIIAQVTVDITGLATAAEIAHRVFEAECDIYPQVLHRLVRGELPLEGKIYRYHFTPI
jgi:folate-dependent phosphoribosylglycinamide formyltransferase PurN